MLALLLMLTGCDGGSSALAGEWIAAFYRVDAGTSAAATGDAGASAGSTSDTGASDSSASDSGASDSGAADTGDTGEVLPACEGDVGAESFRAWLRIDGTQPVEGTHLTLYPDGPEEERPEASNGEVPSSAMAGLVTGAWQGGVVQLDLVPDLDYALATEVDREAWRAHHLRLESEVWGDRCWSARWAWVDTAGTPDPTEQGVVFVRRQ